MIVVCYAECSQLEAGAGLSHHATRLVTICGVISCVTRSAASTRSLGGAVAVVASPGDLISLI